MTSQPRAFHLGELSNTYCDPQDRFVVSLIVSYDPARDGVATPEQAVGAALRLVMDPDGFQTHWYVYDRATHTLHLIEQANAEDPEGDDSGSRFS